MQTTDLTPLPSDESLPLPAAKATPSEMSSTLFSQVLYDIAVQHYGLPEDAFFCGRVFNGDKVIGCGFIVENLARGDSVKVNARLRALMRDIKVEDFDNQITMDTDELIMVYDNKLAFYKILKNFLDSDEHDLNTPESIYYRKRYPRTHGMLSEKHHPYSPESVLSRTPEAQASFRTQAMTEHLHRQARLAREAAAEGQNVGENMFYTVENTPYASRALYEKALYKASVPDISVSMNHLLKTICFEDKIDPATLPNHFKSSEAEADQKLSRPYLTLTLDGGYH